VRFTRGFGTSAAHRVMTKQHYCRFGRPQVARRVVHRDVRNQIERVKDDVRRAVAVRPLRLSMYIAVQRERQAQFGDCRSTDVSA
jgi:hypothetical protein